MKKKEKKVKEKHPADVLRLSTSFFSVGKRLLFVSLLQSHLATFLVWGQWGASDCVNSLSSDHLWFRKIIRSLRLI